MKLNLEITPEFINLFDVNTQRIYNQIPLSELDRTITINNKLHSYWIEQYFNHIFIRKHHMYKLAQFISEQYPNNRISWFSLMYKIEFYQKLLDIEFFQSDNSETFNRDLFNIDQDYLYSCAEKLSRNHEEIAKLKGIVITQMANYNLM